MLSMEQEKLHEIDEELTKNEVAALKFLCMDHIRKKRLESVSDAKDLFMLMSEQALLEDELFLAELLCIIQRYDLLAILGKNKSEVSTLLKNKRISPYRKLLYELSEDMTENNVRNVKFLLEYLPKSKFGPSATFLDILVEMEKMQKLGEDNLDELVTVLDKCDKELANKVHEFKKTQTTKETNSLPESVIESSPTHHQEESKGLSSLTISGHPLSVPDAANRGRRADSLVADAMQAPQESKDYYSLKRRPRGYCLIINNYNFEQSSSLPNRKGTDKDAVDLEALFSRLHFMVHVKHDLSSSEIEETVGEYSKQDHSEMDAFVCFILSHGKKGTVLGVDGEPVMIRDIVQLFASCKSLFGKPKLFFIQACQGDSYQRSIYIQADGDEDDRNNELEEDAEKVELSSIPIAADVLIGMATVEYYKSFRHTMQGSIFIQELCRQIEIGLVSKEDILSILTKVNREVSSQVLNGFKQMPEPRYTLTKKLVFTED